MVGLSASQLPPETLYAGETIAYHSMAFVSGDRRGYREAVLMKVDASPGEDVCPIEITTSEIIQPHQMIKKIYDRAGKPAGGLWRKLRTFAMVSGEVEAETDRSRFATSVNNIVEEVLSGRKGFGPALHEEISQKSSELPARAKPTSTKPSRALEDAARLLMRGAGDLNDVEDEDPYEEKAPATTQESAPKVSTISGNVGGEMKSSTRNSSPSAPDRQRTDAVKLRADARSEDPRKRPSMRSESRNSAASDRAVTMTRSSTTNKHVTTFAEPPEDAAARIQCGGSEEVGEKASARNMDESEGSSGPDFAIVSSDDEACEASRGLDALALVASSHREGDCDQGPRGASEGGDGPILESEEKVEDNEAAAQGDGASEHLGSVDVVALNDYLETIPTRTERAKIRHQPKKRSCGWLQPRSRKKRYQKKAAITRSGTKIHHAHTVKAKKMQDLLKMEGMRNKLAAVRSFRPSFVEPTPASNKPSQINVSQTYVMEAVPWPDWVEPISENVIPPRLKFEDIGDGDACKCEGDCFADTCENAKMAIYCTPDCCKLGARCSNASRTHPALKVYDTHRLGLGVYTTEDLFAGEIIAEYCGDLVEYSALHEGQPEEAKKHNSGYTMLLNEKTKRGRFVYIEALQRGSIARFFQHACKPNVEFVEMQNRSNVKVLARMIESVRAGAQIVVHYGDEIWFKCACDMCWIEPGFE